MVKSPIVIGLESHNANSIKAVCWLNNCLKKNKTAPERRTAFVIKSEFFAIVMSFTRKKAQFKKKPAIRSLV